MDGAVKSYIRSADYAEMQQSAVIFSGSRFKVIEKVENGCKKNDGAKINTFVI